MNIIPKKISKKLITQKITRTVGRQLLIAKKNSPHIFFVGGVIGIVGGTILACRATLKLEETLDTIKTDVDGIKELGDSLKTSKVPYSQKNYVKDLGVVYGKSARSLGRLYGPSIVVGIVSVSALTGSHIQLTRRNTALTATIAAISKAYDDYRIRVKNEVGTERELEIYRAITNQEIENESKKKEIVKVTDPNGWSPYARMFEESNINWHKIPEYSRIFIQCQQNYANHLLRARGHVFLNEVYDSLGLERSQAGQVVGWVLHGEGDNFVDFGLFEAYSSRFLNGEERNIILDFNVDGVIFDKI